MKTALICSIIANCCLFGFLMFMSGALKESQRHANDYQESVSNFEFTNLICVGKKADDLAWGGLDRCERWVRNARAQKFGQ